MIKEEITLKYFFWGGGVKEIFGIYIRLGITARILGAADTSGRQ